jgi:hypothetical protein
MCKQFWHVRVVTLVSILTLCAQSSMRDLSHKYVGCLPLHSGGNDRFCARLKTDISAFSPGLQGHLRSCLTILDFSRRPLSKNVRHDLVRPRRPELEAEMSVFNLSQKRSFPPLCALQRCSSTTFSAQLTTCRLRGGAN